MDKDQKSQTSCKSPQHQRLSLGKAGIDPDMGSIIVIPAPGDYVDCPDLKPLEPPQPHRLVNFGPQKEPILIIPDYRVMNVVPGVDRKNIIDSSLLVKETSISSQTIDSKQESQIFENQTNFDKNSFIHSLLSHEYESFNKIKTIDQYSPLTCLARFTGEDGVVILDFFEQFEIKNLSKLINFPLSHPEFLNLLKEASLFNDINEYVPKIRKMLEILPEFIIEHEKMQNQPKINQEQLCSLKDLPGMNESIYNILYNHAFIQTCQELADFPIKLPGIFAVLEDSGQIPNLQELVAHAKSLSSSSQSSYIGSCMPENNTNYDTKEGVDPHDFIKNGVRTEDLTSIRPSSLVGTLKDMSPTLASKLATLYPPVYSLQDLANFAEVNPSEFAYLARDFPSLRTLCNQAALLISVVKPM